MPNNPASSPFVTEPWLSVAIRTSAMNTSAKFSNGPKTSAKRAIQGDSNTSASHDKAPPISDAEMPRPNARPGLPPRAIGNPSSVVTTADGSPGMRINVAVIKPPEMPPT